MPALYHEMERKDYEESHNLMQGSERLTSDQKVAGSSPADAPTLRSKNSQRCADAAATKRGSDSDRVLTSTQSASKSVDNESC